MRLEPLSAPTKVRIGISVALLGLIGLCEGIGLGYYQMSRHRLVLLCLTFGVMGLLSWSAAQFQEGKRGGPLKLVNEALLWEHPLLFLKSLKYWGLILIFSGGIAYILGDFTAHGKPIIVNARQKASAPAPVSFPPLKLQGLILQGAKSSALINGQVLRVGEGIGQVRVVAIGREQVTVGLDGQTTVLRLRDY